MRDKDKIRNNRIRLRDKYRHSVVKEPKRLVTCKCLRCGTLKDCLTTSEDALVTKCKKCGIKMIHQITRVHDLKKGVIEFEI